MTSNVRNGEIASRGVENVVVENVVENVDAGRHRQSGAGPAQVPEEARGQVPKPSQPGSEQRQRPEAILQEPARC